MRLVDYVISRLQSQNVKHIFMITGRGVLYLSDAVARNSNISAVCAHNEQAGSYAAMAYGQTCGLGVQIVSTGCASTNALTGCLCAWQDEISVIFISGQNKLNETVRNTGVKIRTYGQQEADIISIVKSITKYSVMIDDPNRIGVEMDKALYHCLNGRKGPVWIDIPLDIQSAIVSENNLERWSPHDDSVLNVQGLYRDDIAEIIKSLSNALRPVIFIGSGIRRDGACAELKCFASKLNIPVVSDPSGGDILDPSRYLYGGIVSTLGANRSANFIFQNADYVLVLGSKLNSMTVGDDPQKICRNGVIDWVDIDDSETTKNTVRFRHFIPSNLKDFLNCLLEATIRPDSSAMEEWTSKVRHWINIFPKCPNSRKGSNPFDLYEVADFIGQHIGDDAIVVTDAGLEELIVPSAISYKEHQRCLHPVSQGAMGYAIPAAYGAYCASGKSIICITGDGSAMMNLQELQTIVTNHFPIKIFIINNDCYAVIRERQIDLFRTRTIGTDPNNGVSCANYEKVAQAFGIPYVRVNNETGLTPIISAINAPGCVICEIFTTSEQTVLHSSFTRNQNKRFVKRPLEDQSPFLDRELFLREMIVEPIDQ